MSDTLLGLATFAEIEAEMRHRYPGLVVGVAFPVGTTDEKGNTYDYCIHGERLLCSGLLAEMARSLTAQAVLEESKDED